jgi:hypothetical protein
VLHIFARFAALVALGFCAVDAAQSPIRRQPPDLLPLIQLTQAMVAELKATCLARHPDLKDEIERAYQEWILYPVKISVQVNGKEYVSPTITSMLEDIRAELAKPDDPRTRKECEEFRNNLSRMLEHVPREALVPFLPQGTR